MTSRTSLRASPQAGEAISYTYGEGSAGPHAVTSSLRAEGEAISISYDANGNMTSKTVIASPQGEAISAYSYDIENRLTEVATPKEEYISNYQIPLQTGYNFVSIPLVVTDNIETILNNSGITDAEISRLNAQTGAWEFFIFDNGSVFGTPDFLNFDYGRGYEIYLERNSTLTFSGVTPLSDKTLELYSGDNLIAAPTTTSVSVEEALAGITYISVKAASSLRGVQDPEAISYVDVTELQAGYSYFINVATQKTWNIPREKDKTTYVYDGDGGRVMSLRTPKLRGEAISTTYIGSSYETSLRAGGEAISKKHIFMGSTRVCTVETVGTTTDYFYFHQDHIGSSNVVTDETGQLAKLIEYSPYGLTAREEGSYNTDYKFTGKLFDTSTELYYYGARYYDPDLGRFIQPDTIVPYPDDPQSFNRYAYARNNPIRYVDPTGHSWFSKLIGAIVGIATYIGMGGPANPGAIPAAMAAFSFTDSAIASYQAGYNVFESVGIAAVTASVAYAGATFGAELFTWGGAEAIAAFGAGAFGGMSGGVAHAAITGGNIGLGALSGLAAGATGGLFATSGNLFLSAAGSAVAGGVGSSVAGGGFAAGATEGAYAAAANAAMTTAVASGNLQGGRDGVAEAANDNGKHPQVAKQQHDQNYVETVKDPGKISKFQQFKQSKGGAYTQEFLSSLSQYATVAGSATFIAGFIPASAVFFGIAALASALEISVFSPTPLRDTAVESIKMIVGDKVGEPASLLTDEVIDIIDSKTH